MKKYFFILILLISSLQLNFAYENGNWLYHKGLKYKKLENGKIRTNNFDSSIDIGLYSGYIIGVTDTWYGILFCPSSHVTNEQIFDIVFKYLDKYPEKRNDSADHLIVEALQKIWPCNNKFKLSDIKGILLYIEDLAKKCKLNDNNSCYLLAGFYYRFGNFADSIFLYKNLCKKFKKNKNTIVCSKYFQLKKKMKRFCKKKKNNKFFNQMCLKIQQIIKDK
jgi:hypothetical protein